MRTNSEPTWPRFRGVDRGARRGHVTERATLLLLAALCSVCTARSGFGDLPPVELPADCAALERPAGLTTTLGPGQAAELAVVVAGAAPGTTVFLLDGTYRLEAPIEVVAARVSLRSLSGKRDAVVLDAGRRAASVVRVSAPGVLVADLTLLGAGADAVVVTGAATGFVLYNARVEDAGGAAVSSGDGTPDAGTVACSRLELTAAGRVVIPDPADATAVNLRGVAGWALYGNRIQGFWSDVPILPAVSCYKGCLDVRIERNTLIDNWAGIRVGNYDVAPVGARLLPFECASTDGYFDAVGGVVRNNIAFTSDTIVNPDSGIAIWDGCGTRVVHNTVVSTQPPFSSIEWRWESNIELTNNLVGHRLLARGGEAAARGNIEGATLAWFVDAPGHDLHLRADAVAVDASAPLDTLEDRVDIDLDVRRGLPDAGADEVQ